MTKIFVAHYVNTKNGLEFIRKIKVMNHFCGNEESCYIEAMKKAYNMAWEDESLMSIEVLAF